LDEAPHSLVSEPFANLNASLATWLRVVTSSLILPNYIRF